MKQTQITPESSREEAIIAWLMYWEQYAEGKKQHLLEIYISKNKDFLQKIVSNEVDLSSVNPEVVKTNAENILQENLKAD